MKKYFFLFIILLHTGINTFAQTEKNAKKILILHEGDFNMKSQATGVARQLGTLLGHFNTENTYKGDNQYKTNELNKFE